MIKWRGSTRIVIGVCGDIGSGKDHVADYLVDRHNFEKMSFATELKEMCYRMLAPLGAERRHFFGTQEDKNEPLTFLLPRVGEREDGTRGMVPEFWTGRSFLEWFGTDVVRARIHPDYWVRLLMNRVLAGVHLRVVIADARFPNEHRAIREFVNEFDEEDRSKVAGLIWRTKIDGTIHRDLWRAGALAEPPSQSPCPTTLDWRRSCKCGAIESTGHESDEVWRMLHFDHLINAPKPGLDILAARVDEVIGELRS